MLRIGIGYDTHRLVKGRRLVLAGAHIPYPKGLLGHSDADVLTHAVCDALLGAVSQGDIGEHFPDYDPAYKDASSLELLKKVGSRLKKLKYSIQNIDSVVLTEKPKLTPFKLKMRKNIAGCLGLRLEQVSIKATTSEGLGPVGKGKLISAYAVTLVQKRR